MNYTIIISSISALAATLSAFSALVMCIIAKRQNEFFKKIETGKNTPYLYPVDHISEKKEWERFFSALSNINDIVPTRHYNDLTPSEKRFCDYSKNHKGEVYFYYLNKKLYLILNKRSEDFSFLVDHNSATITLKNYGSHISKMHIDYVKQYFKDRIDYYEGKQDAFYTNIILPDDKLEIVLDEIKDGLDTHSCPPGKEEIKEINTWKMFEDIIPPMITYEMYLIKLSLWNQYDEKFEFEIKIYRNGDRFYREVTQLQKEG